MQFTDTEKALMNAPAPGFPMIVAASVAANRCGTCGERRGMGARTLLQAAVTRYMRDPAFREHVKNTVGLPAVIAGVRFA